MSDPDLLWKPSAERVEQAALTAFQRWLGETRGLELTDYDALWRWSVDDLKGFWSAIVEYFDVRLEPPDAPVLSSYEMPGAKWFPGTTTSYVEPAFRGKDAAALAIQHASELRPLGSWTWGELREQTARIKAGLERLGVTKGDRVVAYMPNIPETVAAFFACAAIGATWSSAAPEFGARSVIDRFSQIE